VTRWVLHVDLDQFIAAVEVLRHPELRGRPVVVGGDGDPAKRGVVSTASYEARAFGVHSGLALRTARRRCPDAVFLPVDAGAYEAVSAEVMAALAGFDAVLEVAGWDEAFLAADTDDPEALARRIQDRIRVVTSLYCTVGIGENKLQAKLAAGFGKPAGIFRLTHESWYTVLGDRPTDALWGVGTKTARRLAALGIHTVADLAGTDPRHLAAHLGPVTGPWLVQTARGLSPGCLPDRPVLRGAGECLPRRLSDLSLLYPAEGEPPLGKRLGAVRRRFGTHTSRRFQAVVGDQLPRQPVDRGRGLYLHQRGDR